MCDTVVALGNVTADGITVFGKNSDREPNEAHYLEILPAARHAPGSALKCTYVEIAQVERTNAVLLARPFWIWGGEMGANEHGVAIGNEALFTRVPYEQGPGLTGMDLLRLALERASSARAALDVITGLLEQYGQGGNCGLTRPSYYHNSFLIADPHSAWVLETAGRQWAAELVTGIRTISNEISIGDHWDLASPDLVAYAVDRGWCRGRADFNFGRCYSDVPATHRARARTRRSCTANVLGARRGAITVESVLRALRDHGAAAADDWTPDKGLSSIAVCAHAAAGPVRGWQTTGSMASHLAPGMATHFVTGTAAPCTGIFKPVWIDAGLPDTGPMPGSRADADSLFWRHERLHRATLDDYAGRSACYRAQRDALESDFLAGALDRCSRPRAERAAYSAECFVRAAEAEQRWTEAVLVKRPAARPRPLYRSAWRRFDRAAGLGQSVTHEVGA